MTPWYKICSIFSKYQPNNRVAYLNIAVCPCHVGALFQLLPSRSCDLSGGNPKTSPLVYSLSINAIGVQLVGEKAVKRCLFSRRDMIECCYVQIPKESGCDRERKIKGRKRIRLIAINYRSATGTAGTRCRRSKSASQPESGTDSGGPLRDTGTEVLDQSREDGKK